MEKGTVKLLETEQEKFLMRMKMTYEERFRAFMKATRFKAKLKQATIIKPN
ncbi:MAG: hypothetical protein V4590_07725 [Bacteroidota bacterium]